jgi:diguanylate cyclase (GGDEF)-like protein
MAIQVLGKLLNQDVRILFAMDGQCALDMALSEQPDLILLDVIMPGLNGYELCARLKADPATEHIPVIFVTSMGDEADEARGLRAGAIDYICKPYSSPIISNRIKNILEFKKYGDMFKMLSSVDGLTGLANRRYFDAALTREWWRLMRNKLPISLAFLDIDFFKGYNDHYGHLAGDDCLRRVANILTAVPNRPGDLVARWGGEEFAVILPETDLEGAQKIAEKLREAVAALELPNATPLAIAGIVTVSLGVSTVVPTPGSLPKSLIQTADENLYKAKDLGRNRIFPALL